MFWRDLTTCRYVGNFGVTEISPKTLEAYGITWPQDQNLKRLARIAEALQEHKWITDQAEPWLASL
jgi:hypothetical protein